MIQQVVVPALISISFLSGTGVLFALLLVIAERKILNYGPCVVDINKGKKKLTQQGGGTLLGSLAAHDIFIPSACGGRGSCSYCKVKVLSGGGSVGPVEEPYLTAEEKKAGIRLSCQVKVRSDIAIEIPEAFFLVRRYKGRCYKKTQLTYDTVLLDIELADGAVLPFTAGQYVQLETREYKGRESVIRAYSIASTPSNRGHVELIIRRVPEGICTTWVFDVLKEGEPLSLSGPYGDFRLSDAGRPALFFAGGSGMAPFWSMLRDMAERGDSRRVHYFYSGRTQQDLYLGEELQALCGKLPGFTYVPTLTREPEGSDWKGARGRISAVLDAHVADVASCEAYLCGSWGLIEGCVAAVKERGISSDRIFYDKFD